MLALCSMLRHTYYAQNYAGIIRTGLQFGDGVTGQGEVCIATSQSGSELDEDV